MGLPISELPEFIKRIALQRTEEDKSAYHQNDSSATRKHGLLIDAFSWTATKEGHDVWYEVDKGKFDDFPGYKEHLKATSGELNCGWYKLPGRETLYFFESTESSTLKVVGAFFRGALHSSLPVPGDTIRRGNLFTKEYLVPLTLSERALLADAGVSLTSFTTNSPIQGHWCNHTNVPYPIFYDKVNNVIVGSFENGGLTDRHKGAIVVKSFLSPISKETALQLQAANVSEYSFSYNSPPVTGNPVVSSRPISRIRKIVSSIGEVRIGDDDCYIVTDRESFHLRALGRPSEYIHQGYEIDPSAQEKAHFLACKKAGKWVDPLKSESFLTKAADEYRKKVLEDELRLADLGMWGGPTPKNPDGLWRQIQDTHKRIKYEYPKGYPCTGSSIETDEDMLSITVLPKVPTNLLTSND